VLEVWPGLEELLARWSTPMVGRRLWFLIMETSPQSCLTVLMRWELVSPGGSQLREPTRGKLNAFFEVDSEIHTISLALFQSLALSH
jgi:hypothetical protein